MITIADLCKNYGPKTAVKNISFSVEKGEVLGFLGPNGAGKTTTMKIITGFMPPTAGSVAVMGFDTVKDSRKARACIGYLPENNPLYTDMRVENFLNFVAGAKGVRGSAKKTRVGEVLESCGLVDVRRRMIGRLSKGYRQRVGLAQALVNDPPVLILDEPTIGLDPRQIFEIRNLIKNLAAQRTIVLSSHILPEVSQLCQRVAIINKGEVVAIDTPANLTAGMNNAASITVKVGGRAPEAAALLEQIPGVRSVKLSGADALIVEAAPQADARPEIARAIVSAGIPLIELMRREMSLEEIFMHLITKEEEVAAHA